MDDILTNAGMQPVAPEQQPTDVAAQQVAPNLGQSERQAPAPTSDANQAGDTTSTGSEPRMVPYEEYERLQQQFQEHDQFVNQMRQMAETQIAEDEWNQYKQGAVSQVKAEMERNGTYDEDSFGVVARLINQNLDAVRGDFSQKFTEYQNTMKGWATDFEWQNTREQEADRLISTYKLHPAIKAELLKAPTRENMTERAETAKMLNDLYMQQNVNAAIQQQVQDRRNSGVDAIGGVTGGPMQPRELKPDNADAPHLRAALKSALGIG